MTDLDRLKHDILERKDRLPVHIAIIMDGNGRWAAMRDKPRTFGHEAGVKAVREVVRASAALGVKYLTLYTFSVENWARPADEVNALMSLLVRTTLDEMEELMKNDVKLMTIGRLDGLSEEQRAVIDEAVKRTRDNAGLELILALNYGSRSEILDAVRAISKAVKAGMIDYNNITEDLFSEFLYTANIPDPDLLIRTSGERRISNFLLWQTSYTELNIVDTLWPDFGEKELYECILDYQGRERRFGKVLEKGIS
jgi:undecaprenyl diphosphate synthase